MMKFEDARRLGLTLFNLGFTPWIAETGDGYMVRVLIEGEIVSVFLTDVEAFTKN